MESNTTSLQSGKWTEIELLPEWEEDYYHVYTAKKHGKWVMLKTLKPEYASLPEYKALIEKEFDVRYNLAHPNIVMINDYEEVPGLGMCIIADDVYGDSLRKLINQKKVTPEIVDKLKHQLVDAMEYIQANHIVHHPIRPETIIFTEIGGNLKLIDVGFDQRQHLEPADASEDIYNYGMVLNEALDNARERYPNLRRVAQKCSEADPRRRYRDVQDLHLALERRTSNQLYILLIIFLSAMIVFLAWLNARRPSLQQLGITDNNTELVEDVVTNQNKNGN